MTAIVAPAPIGRFPRPVRDLFRREPLLAWFGLILVGAMLPVAAAAFVDARLFNGVNVWVKPLKFLASLALFALTMAWLARDVAPAFARGRAMAAMRWTLVLTTTFEMAYIAWKAGQGEASHFNVGDPFHAAMYQAMGIAAVVLTGTTLVLAWGLARHAREGLEPVYRLAAVVGLVLTFALGVASGFAMGGQTSHFAGGIQEAPGLPIVGWSTIGGDWRVAHFFGLHAQQVFPVAGMIAARLAPAGGRTAILAFGAAYSLFTVALIVQAAMNIPFIRL